MLNYRKRIKCLLMATVVQNDDGYISAVIIQLQWGYKDDVDNRKCCKQNGDRQIGKAFCVALEYK